MTTRGVFVLLSFFGGCLYFDDNALHDVPSSSLPRSRRRRRVARVRARGASEVRRERGRARVVSPPRVDAGSASRARGVRARFWFSTGKIADVRCAASLLVALLAPIETSRVISIN
jgi:hypothetical protein